MQSFLDQIVITSGEWSLSVLQLAISILILLASIIVYRRVIGAKWLTMYFEKSMIDKAQIKKLHRLLLFFLIFLTVFLMLKVLNLDYQFFENNTLLKLSLIFEGLLILQGARILAWLITNTFIHRYYSQRDIVEKHRSVADQADVEKTGSRVVQSIVYIIAAFFLINQLNLDFTFFTTDIPEKDGGGELKFTLSKFILAVLILLVSRLVVWLATQLFLYGVYKKRGVDKGSQFAINQLLKYFIYFIAVFVALEHLGINMTLIWTGAAALLVGVGLGLQQTFNDFISGLVLLFERSTQVGDILEFGGNVGIIREIGLRASVIETRQNISMVVPNSKLVNENVINWSHYSNRVRFEVSVGVAYGSDTAAVKEILFSVVNDHDDVMPYPKPFVRFNDFGDSALLFTVYFFSRNFMFIENVKSDIRFEIDKRFRAHNITIPFPQRDVWFKNAVSD